MKEEFSKLPRFLNLSTDERNMKLNMLNAQLWYLRAAIPVL